jgi:L,D-peptidoglycan transpeptidase YkuD (ErfK/YbiS/YcfS/YnhG family)
LRSIEVDTRDRLFHLPEWSSPCILGRAGSCDASEKSEGDGKTPRGEWPLLGVLLRPDKDWRLPAFLPWRWLRPQDGWSDDPRDGAYNRPVRHPHAWSAEKLWRDDRLYDVIVLLGHNHAPPIAGAGSAIFLHLQQGAATEGCVAIEDEAMRMVLRDCHAGDILHIG